ncbi:hypothetical protein [Allobacillus halotolerans]|uniref:Uncharacterized protein n=1 Tax=Allobacillus halotolerans TaxID=570278 RepID=A0ABS6GMA1_9BACI|nr:hypothetical protein [Allobacillus halotolerans]MBU6080247.1 hypothetical protein [Allobacillus halotolerans]
MPLTAEVVLLTAEDGPLTVEVVLLTAEDEPLTAEIVPKTAQVTFSKQELAYRQ